LPSQAKLPANRGAAEGVLAAIREGFRARDAARVASVYAENAVCTIVNRNNPPSRPMVLRGRAALVEVLRDTLAREMTHEITHVTMGEAGFAWRLECVYPDGCKVVGLYMSSLEGGLVVSEFSVDCWDE
jgi:hypothetical protein